MNLLRRSQVIFATSLDQRYRRDMWNTAPIWSPSANQELLGIRSQKWIQHVTWYTFSTKWIDSSQNRSSSEFGVTSPRNLVSGPTKAYKFQLRNGSKAKACLELGCKKKHVHYLHYLDQVDKKTSNTPSVHSALRQCRLQEASPGMDWVMDRKSHVFFTGVHQKT